MPALSFYSLLALLEGLLAILEPCRPGRLESWSPGRLDVWRLDWLEDFRMEDKRLLLDP